MSKKKDISEKKNQEKRSKSQKVENILPFELKSLKKQKVETEREIWMKMENYSKELVEAFREKANKEKIDRDHSWYLFYYYVKQAMMYEMAYTSFKYYTTWVNKQLLKNHKEFMNSFEEWITEDNYDNFGRMINKKETIH